MMWRPGWGVHVGLAACSGVPALVYQVVWTREVALIAGSQVEAISVVLAAFFGGLAVGARVLGGISDRVASPLRLYGGLEVVAGALAITSPFLIRAVGAALLGRVDSRVILAILGAMLCAPTFLLGGTLPALLRSAVRDAAAGAGGAARTSGWLAGVNTAGAVAGVAAAAVLIPTIGLALTAVAAGSVALIVGLVAIACARGATSPPPAPAPAPTPIALPPRDAPARHTPAHTGVPFGALAVAGLAGISTLAFEVLAARTAALWLGSSLIAWALVLGLFLVGLAAGNVLSARRAERGTNPRRDLGVVETTAALVLAAGVAWTVPGFSTGARGLTLGALLALSLWVLPTTALMGAAFPLFVRLGVRRAESVGAAFGAVSAVNTAGGIAGALLGPFLLLPVLGLKSGLLACAGLNAALGLALLFAAGGYFAERLLRPVVAVLVLAGGVSLSFRLIHTRGPAGARLIHISHGRQATAAVVRSGGHRHLIVDGDQEASTGGDARVTEEMLAILPMVLHSGAHTFLEVGLGSGITLGTATQLPLERIECVEIAAAVVECAPYFAPQNRGVATGRDDVRITLGDGRAYLVTHAGEYDVVVANTLHPWSVGATGLYSREYFERIRRALRPGGVAAQWLPLARLGEESLAAILRTFFVVFPEGELWWGAENLFVIGRRPGDAADREGDLLHYAAAAPELRRLGIDTRRELMARRLAGAAEVLEVLGPGTVLRDDRPLLEISSLRRRARESTGEEEIALAARIAAIGAAGEPIHDWLESRVARARGDEARADELETRAVHAGLDLARQWRARRLVVAGIAARARGDLADAEARFDAALEDDPGDPNALFALAAVALQRRNPAAARRELERLTDEHPDHVDGWRILASLRWDEGDRDGARAALDRALEADPFAPETLGSAGLLAVRAGDLDRAREMMRRLREIDPRGTSQEVRALEDAMRE